MNDNVKKWIEALRSGKYGQTKGKLRNYEENEFCCLGVACDVFAKETGQGYWSAGGVFHINGDYYESNDNVLPKTVMEWLGLRNPSGTFNEYTPRGNKRNLAMMNDHGGTFENIAKLLEREPKGMFVD